MPKSVTTVLQYFFKIFAPSKSFHSQFFGENISLLWIMNRKISYLRYSGACTFRFAYAVWKIGVIAISLKPNSFPSHEKSKSPNFSYQSYCHSPGIDARVRARQKIKKPLKTSVIWKWINWSKSSKTPNIIHLNWRNPALLHRIFTCMSCIQFVWAFFLNRA